MNLKHSELSQIFTSKNDPSDIRLGDCIHREKLSSLHGTPQSDFFLLGYPDDEGVKNNGGRPGAALGPDSIRSILYKSTPPAALTTTEPKVSDLGNIDISLPLAERHLEARALIVDIYKNTQANLISLGGGHDYAYPDVSAFLEARSHKADPAFVINFDAHLDVRPDHNGINSGTPFFRLLNEFPKSFHFLELGLQTQCNSKKHYEWLKSKGGEALWYEEIETQDDKAFELFCSKLPTKITDCFVSIDLDAFSSAYAPGCSQSWPTGLSPQFFWRCFRKLLSDYQVRGIGLYECSPPLDLDMRTSRLAAKIVYDYIFFGTSISSTPSS